MTIGQTKKIETLTLAPDALVFINGSDTLNVCPVCNCGISIRDAITAINIDLSVDSAPGSASLTFTNPQHLATPLVDEISSGLKAMQEVEIYMKSRFTKNGKFTYYPVFWGFISTVSENYSDGNYTVTANCKDILRWWELSKINIKPGALDITTFSNLHPVIFEKSFSDIPIPQIIRDLAQISVNELLPIQNLTEASNNADTIDSQSLNLDLVDYWRERFGQIGRALRIFGYNNSEFENANLPDITSRNIKLTETDDPTPTDEDAYTQGGKRIVSDDTNRRSLFGYNIAEIERVLPSTLSVGSVGTFATEPMSKLDIANEVKEVIKYEFYMDSTGEIIFKPPFYNMDVRENNIHVIEALDITDWGLTEDESGVVTRFDVTGSYTEHQDNATNAPIYGVYVDYKLQRQFGIRFRKASVPFLRKNEQCEVYAQSEVSRLNALLKTGSITIIGRPELRIGYPIYVKPRDSFYYVTGISHTFTFGSDFTTTLTITGERRKLYKPDGITPLKNLAIILDDIKADNENTALHYAIDIRRKDPSVSDGVIYRKVQEKFTLENVIINKVVNKSREAIIPTSDSGDINPLLRIHDPCINEPFIKTRLSTIDNIDIGSNQGKKARFVENYKVVINNLTDLRNNLQITDENGYELIGTFPYGRYSEIKQSLFGSRTLQEIDEEGENDFKEQVFMVPKTEEKRKDTDKDDYLTTIDNLDKMMVSIFDENTASQQIKDMRLEIEQELCNCSCHHKRR